MAAIADVCHRHGAVLIVDEAHGAHSALRSTYNQARPYSAFTIADPGELCQAHFRSCIAKSHTAQKLAAASSGSLGTVACLFGLDTHHKADARPLFPQHARD